MNTLKIKEVMLNNPRLTLTTIAIVSILIAFKLLSGGSSTSELSIADMEAKVKAEITSLDDKRKSQIEEANGNIEKLKECILSVKKENGSITAITPCKARS